MAEEQYILLEAAEKLGVSKATLFNWIRRAGLSETVESQVDEVDRRSRYLTRGQLEKLAKDHRTKLTLSTPSRSEPKPEEVVESVSVRTKERATRFKRGLWKASFTHLDEDDREVNETHDVWMQQSEDLITFKSLPIGDVTIWVSLYIRDTVVIGEWRQFIEHRGENSAPIMPSYTGTLRLTPSEDYLQLQGKWRSYDLGIDEGTCEFTFVSERLPRELIERMHAEAEE